MTEAIRAGVAFLTGAQLASGEFPTFLSLSPDMSPPATPDPAIFPTALIVRALGHCGGAEALRAAAARFLAAARKPGDLWSHWPADHPTTLVLPPDVDDTACASLALAAEGRPVAANRDVLLGNRDRRGLFYTWILVSPRWRGRAHLAATWRQLLHLPTRYLFFRRTAAAPDDVDAVVNANALAWLGAFQGDQAVIGFLIAALRARNEHCCDKYYDDPVVVRYFFSLALAGRCPAAAELIVPRTLAAEPGSALQLALALSTLALWNAPAPALWRQRLLGLQQSEGSWPMAPLYTGGRARRVDGRCGTTAPDQARWGSEALTTAFCLEALGRSQAVA